MAKDALAAQLMCWASGSMVSVDYGLASAAERLRGRGDPCWKPFPLRDFTTLSPLHSRKASCTSDRQAA
jgi:hypothetical protein